MKYRKKITTFVIILLLLVLVILANIWHRRSVVHDVRADIDYGQGHTLVTPQQVAAIILHALPDLTSTTLRDVDLNAVAKAASASPYLKECQASTSISGDIVLYARQREAIMRVYTAKETYYIDDQFHRMPLSKIGSPDIIVCNGNLKKSGLKEAWTLAYYLHTHEDIAPLFDQIYRDDEGDLYLTPKLGNHIVQVGDTLNLDDKFHNLIALYSRGLPQAGWETYSQVSLKYKGQVVCTKRSTNESGGQDYTGSAEL